MAHPTNEERVDAEEQRLGRRLPSQLRDRLIEENGGEVESDEPFNDHWELYGVADLRSDKKGRSWMADGLADVTEREVESWGEAWQMPDDVVVIAANGSGDLLLLLADDTYGVRDHETRELIPTGVRLRPGEGGSVMQAE